MTHSFFQLPARLALLCGVLIVVMPSYSVPSAFASYVIPSQPIHQGHGTAALRASATVSARFAGFDVVLQRGSDTPLGVMETDYLCSMQRAMPKGSSTALIEWFSRTVADVIGRDVRVVMPILKDPSYCSQRSVPARVRKADVIVHLNKRGTVVSRNPVWNACVSGTALSLALIRSNTDTIKHRQGSRRKIFVRTCRDYHRGDLDLWQHPDYPGLEIQLDSKGRLLSGLPSGFVAKKDVKDVPTGN